MKKNVVIEGSCAVAIGSDGRLKRPTEHVAVKTALDASAQKNDPNAQHVCPLCNDWLPWEAFVAHAPECIRIRAPRRQVWTPPGTEGQLLSFPTKRKFGEV